MKGMARLASILALGIGLGLTPGQAASECGVDGMGGFPVPGVGVVVGARAVERNQPGQSCTFTAGPGMHGYVAALDHLQAGFRIFLDPNNNQRLDPREQVLAETGAPAGPLTIDEGALVTVQFLGGCSPVGCGYWGFVLVV